MRLVINPEGHEDRTFYEEMKARIRERWRAARLAYHKAEAEYEKWKRGEPGHTTNDLALFLLRLAVENFRLKSSEMLFTLGFELERGTTEAAGWNAKQMLSHMVSLGFADSALSVWRTYLETGSERAALVAALWQLAFMLPYTSDANRLAEAFRAETLKEKAKPLVIMLAGWFVPGAGRAYLLCNLATNAVWIAGYYVFEPLRDDVTDKVYQGFLEKAGGTEQSQRPSLLQRVKIRVVPLPIKEAPDCVRFLFAPYPFEEARELGWLEVSDEKTHEQDYRMLREDAQVLGGGAEWDRALAEAENWLGNPKLNFEARRASLYYTYGAKAKALLEKLDISIYEPTEKTPNINAEAIEALKKNLFDKTLQDWLTGSGEFAGVVDGEVNELIARKVAEVKDRISYRMAADFVRSWLLIKGRTGIEANVVANAKRAREERLRLEMVQRAAAQHRALTPELDPAMADALHAEVHPRRVFYREGAPRIRVRPRVFKVEAEKDEDGEAAEVLVSVLCDPDLHPAPYKVEADWRVVPKKDEKVLAVKVTVRDANGAQVGKAVEETVGTIYDPDKTGPLQIRGRRDRLNEIEVTSEALAKLDDMPGDTELEYTLYRAEEGKEPVEATETKDSPQFQRRWKPKTPVQESPDWSRRVAKDRVILVDIFSDRREGPGKPWVYQIGERWIVGGKRGEETRSNVTVPRPFVRVGGLGDDEEVLKKPSRNGEWWEFPVSLSCADQNYDYWGAALTATSGPYKGHFWTGRREGKLEFGIRKVTLSDAPTIVRVPFSPDGATVVISAESAERAIRIPPSPEPARERWIQEAGADFERDRKSWAAQKPECEARVKEDEKTVAECARLVKDAGTAYSLARAQDRLIQATSYIRWMEEYVIPDREAYRDARIAFAKADWKAFVKHKNRQRRLVDTGRTLELEKAEAFRTAYRKILDHSPTGALKEEVDRILSTPTTHIEENHRHGLCRLAVEIADAALRCGDAAQYESSVAEAAGLLKGYELDELRNRMPADAALVRGDREKAAGLLPVKQREWMRKSKWPLPTWLPEGFKP